MKDLCDCRNNAALPDSLYEWRLCRESIWSSFTSTLWMIVGEEARIHSLILECLISRCFTRPKRSYRLVNADWIEALRMLQRLIYGWCKESACFENKGKCFSTLLICIMIVLWRFKQKKQDSRFVERLSFLFLVLLAHGSRKQKPTTLSCARWKYLRNAWVPFSSVVRSFDFHPDCLFLNLLNSSMINW